MAEGCVNTFPITEYTDPEMFEEQQILQPLNRLQCTLQGMPNNILQFSVSLRMLYNQNAVSGEHDSATKFLELRDITRKNALIYTCTLLPQSEDVIKKIRAYAFEITACDFDEWYESLEEITKEVTDAEKACKLLLQLHEDLITELKKNEDDAEIGMAELDKLTRVYEAEKKKLIGVAEEYMHSKDWYDNLGRWLLIPTLSIGYFVAKSKAGKEQDKADKSLIKATAANTNGEICHKAVNLTKNCLIPAIKNFLDGLSACSDFLTATRVNLSEMSSLGENAQENKKKRYFRLMKKHAEDLSENCMFFMTSSSHIRTNLQAIPTEPNDKNYVDKWVDAQMKKFEKTNPGIWDTMAKWSRLRFNTPDHTQEEVIVEEAEAVTSGFVVLGLDQ